MPAAGTRLRHHHLMNISPSGLSAGNYIHATNVTDNEHLKSATTMHNDAESKVGRSVGRRQHPGRRGSTYEARSGGSASSCAIRRCGSSVRPFRPRYGGS